jgi:hypothetical protein
LRRFGIKWKWKGEGFIERIREVLPPTINKLKELLKN